MQRRSTPCPTDCGCSFRTAPYERKRVGPVYLGAVVLGFELVGDARNNKLGRLGILLLVDDDVLELVVRSRLDILGRRDDKTLLAGSDPRSTPHSLRRQDNDDEHKQRKEISVFPRTQPGNVTSWSLGRSSSTSAAFSRSKSSTSTLSAANA